jgi:hypothetical protein
VQQLRASEQQQNMADAAASSDNSDVAEVVKSRRPVPSAFNQQQLPSFSPVFTPRTIITIYTVVGLFFILLGSSLYAVNSGAQDYEFKYDGDSADGEGETLNAGNHVAGKSCLATR